MLNVPAPFIKLSLAVHLEVVASLILFIPSGTSTTGPSILVKLQGSSSGLLLKALHVLMKRMVTNINVERLPVPRQFSVHFITPHYCSVIRIVILRLISFVPIFGILLRHCGPL
ncbi:hypothetical protein CPB84DRAFT_1786208 [Gymnopilus junonius]|uniref:Uncharacterized protein n=1 Tax=Gymnopilus junonius TaxID=109634 RepID=A0A9P5TL63_GYMJU|nr:hypothetical protein CPB84DRAFT_1786208 [Gymnopilus junonius]